MVGADHTTATPLVEIIVAEDLTTHAAVRLNLLLTDALDLHPAQLVIDLAGCAYADALAVDVLLTAHKRAWNMGGQLTLRSPSPRVRRLLQLAHVDHVFNVVPPLAAPSGESTGNGLADAPGTRR